VPGAGPLLVSELAARRELVRHVKAAQGQAGAEAGAAKSDLMARGVAIIATALVAVSLVAPAVAAGAGNVNVAALQVALRARSLYTGTIDGIAGPGTRAAVTRLQRRAGLAADGIAGPRTRRALGRLGSHPLGSRTMSPGDVGWDVAALQFRLAWRGFPSGNFDGGFGPHLETAVRRYQQWAGLPGVGIAGPATQRSLRQHPIPACPLRLLLPLRAPIGDGFGPRGDSFHPGLDFVASTGTSVAARGERDGELRRLRHRRLRLPRRAAPLARRDHLVRTPLAHLGTQG